MTQRREETKKKKWEWFTIKGKRRQATAVLDRPTNPAAEAVSSCIHSLLCPYDIENLSHYPPIGIGEKVVVVAYHLAALSTFVKVLTYLFGQA